MNFSKKFKIRKLYGYYFEQKDSNYKIFEFFT